MTTRSTERRIHRNFAPADNRDMEGTETRSAFGLTPDEDEELRRLHAMAEFGSVALHLRDRYLELRRRDRRIEVREPATEVVVEAVTRDEDDE